MIPYDRECLVLVLVNHQRMDAGHCQCGWGQLGASHAQHVANVYEQTVSLLKGRRESDPPKITFDPGYLYGDGDKK